MQRSTEGLQTTAGRQADMACAGSERSGGLGDAGSPGPSWHVVTNNTVKVAWYKQAHNPTTGTLGAELAIPATVDVRLLLADMHVVSRRTGECVWQHPDGARVICSAWVPGQA